MLKPKGLLFLGLAGIVLTACHQQKPAKVGKHDKPEIEAIKHEPPAPKAEPVAPPEQKTNDILAVTDELPSYDGDYTKL